MKHLVGIGEYAISNNEADTIRTLALASCVAVTAYIPGKKAAGMIHIALPRPAGEEEGRLRPFYYAATGIPMFIERLMKQYCCTTDEMEIRIYGGANSINKDDVFNIGIKNIEMVASILYSLKLTPIKYEVGGVISRTIELDVATGTVIMNTQSISI